ncbi:hypothetical protein R5R35_008496 [Gryllus longicercus]
MEIVQTGSLENVDEILKDYRVSTKANDLVSHTSFLKQEMLRSVAEKEGLINKLHEAESKVVSLTEQVRRLEEKLKTQNEENHNLRKEINHATEEQYSIKKKNNALQRALLLPTFE